MSSSRFVLSPLDSGRRVVKYVMDSYIEAESREGKISAEEEDDDEEWKRLKLNKWHENSEQSYFVL